MEFFTFLLCFIFSFELSKIFAISDGVSLSSKWPVSINDLLTFTITKDFDDKSVLVIVIMDKNTINKQIKVGRVQFVDIVTDYYSVKREIPKVNKQSFQIKMSFLKISHEKKLIFRWFPLGITDQSLANSDNHIIYQSIIQLIVKWNVKIIVEIEDGEKIYNSNEKYFQHGKTAKITCRAFDGLPKSRVYFSGLPFKRIRNVDFDNQLNTWIGYITLMVSDHNTNISCYVAETNDITSYTIKVNHPPTTLMLDQEYTGYIKNGSKIRCIASDGYPAPTLNWNYVSVKNHSNPSTLYKIQNDLLYIDPNVPYGTEFVFNCTSMYINPLESDLATFRKSFRFEVGEASNGIETNTSPQTPTNVTDVEKFEKLNKAAIGAGVAGVVIMIIAVSIIVMLCRSKPKPTHSSTRPEGSPKYAGSLLAGSKTALHNQMKSQNGAHSAFIPADTNVSSEPNEFNYDDMPRGRRPIKVIDDPVVYSTIVGTMQPKIRPSLDLGPIDRV